VYSQAFESAVNHEMKYEVGGFWSLDNPGAIDGTSDKYTGYTNDPNDPGGETKYGIAENENPDIDVKNLNWEQAKHIYFDRYWIPSHCDDMPGRLAALHFDGSINIGLASAAKLIQRAVNVTVDGKIGQETIEAIKNADEIALCNSVCDERADYYRNIVQRKPTQAKYLRGWLIRVEEMRHFVTDPDGQF
jgi:lysozyme family protein